MNLTTRWMGFELPHPFIVGASPIADSPESARRAEDAGAAAIVMRSLFEEQITAEALAAHRATVVHADSFPEAMSYLAEPVEYVLGPDAYLDLIGKLRSSLSIPVIASLNGATPGGWTQYALLMEQAGASAIELNLFDVAADIYESSDAIERRGVEVVQAVRGAVGIPLAVKVSPFYSSTGSFASRLVEAGAAGLVLFNRFFEPDIDVESLEVRSHMRLSTSAELPLRLRWLAILSERVAADLAVSGGVHTVLDAVKATMCGADAIQLVSCLLQNGVAHIDALRRGLIAWLDENEYESLEQMRCSMNLERCPNPSAYRRGNYLHMLQTWSRDALGMPDSRA
jgi:dihydroorotate dehydrogenase (fumarate)